ncbi:MAG: TATA-box-binding protein [Promethearchaeota archaeon]|jgi:transcription initiation factor TFIID TATA-box-binding protein
MVLKAKSSENKSSLTYIVQNIVVKSALALNNPLDLNLLSSKLKNSQYNSDRFPGLFERVKHPKCVIIVFKNGKLVLTGLKTSENIDLTIKKLIQKIKNVIPTSIKNDLFTSEIVNIVVTADLGKQINLDKAALLLDNIIYEPEVFPGVIYKRSEPVKSVFLLFSTGKIVLTGIRDENIIEPTLIGLGRLLKKVELFKNS